MVSNADVANSIPLSVALNICVHDHHDLYQNAGMLVSQ